MTERLRVTFCLKNSGIGGTELNALRTAERLDRRRFDLEVVSLSDYPPLRDRYEAAGIPFSTLPIRSLKSADVARRGWELTRHLRERRTQVFHAHDHPGNILGVPWARLAGVPAVIASRRWWKAARGPAHGTLGRIAFGLAHAVLTNTPAVADRTVAEGVPGSKVRVVPNFLDEESFDAPEGLRDGLRAELGLESGARLVGIVAQLRAEKDHETLIRAAARLASRHADVHFVLVGEGEMRPELERLRATLKLEGRVHLAGLRIGEGNLHHAFDLSVLCSRSEALSNSILEAMAAGNPVVATDVGGTPDAVVDGETGCLVPVGDPDALAGALDRILADRSLARRLGEAGRRRARERYAPEAALSGLERTYRELLGTAASAPMATSAYAA